MKRFEKVGVLVITAFLFVAIVYTGINLAGSSLEAGYKAGSKDRDILLTEKYGVKRLVVYNLSEGVYYFKLSTKYGNATDMLVKEINKFAVKHNLTVENITIDYDEEEVTVVLPSFFGPWTAVIRGDFVATAVVKGNISQATS
ncbi:hypothetical protein DRP07_00185 [Archaeoglobales archaeon]|nr:MAG: hypothetical protein DRP07_00185 [Archaeoglobales archaeon]